MIFLKLLYCILLFFVFDILSLCLGYLLFYFGKILHIQFLMRFGHTFIAYHSIPFFGFNKRFIERNCSFKKCNDCFFFTCNGYKKNINSKD